MKNQNQKTKAQLKGRLLSQYKYNKKHPEKVKAIQMRCYWRNRAKRLKQMAALSWKLRLEVLAKYGESCACCSETQVKFLTIDHIKGGGNKHRKEIKNASLYRWLKKNGYPKGFQTLCWNCNCSKGHWGECPHAEIKRG
jgi:hypothetical protein